MPIINFSAFRKEKAVTSLGDWTQQEIADFYRAQRLLAQNGATIGIDRGLTDENDPWMVFYDQVSQDVFLHIARIDGECLLICEPLNMHLTAPTVHSLIVRFEHEVRDYLAIASERSKNVVVHPAARIIMSISAIFLLFKMDGGEAKAQGLSDRLTDNENGAAARVGDKAFPISGRAHSALARIFEQVDSPANIALLAGLVLMGELSHKDPALFSHDSAGEVHATLAALDELVETLAVAEGPIDQTAADISDDSQTVATANAQNDIKLELASLAALINTIKIEDVSVEAAKIVAARAKPAASTSQSEQAEVAPDDAQIITSSFADPSDSDTQGSSNYDLTLDKTDISINDTTNESVALIEEVFGIDFVALLADLKTGALEVDTVSADVDGTTPTADHINAISVASLEQIDDHVGFYAETAFVGETFYNALEYFRDKLGNAYDFDYFGGHILIEEKDVANLADSEIGLWTNIHNDHSKVSVIGSAELIDDIMGFIA